MSGEKARKQESRKAGKQESRKAGKQESRKAGKVDNNGWYKENTCGRARIKKAQLII